MGKSEHSMPKVFGREYMTHELEVGGLVEHPLRVSVAELRSMEMAEVRDLTMVCGSGQELEVIQSYRGVALPVLLKRAEIKRRDRNSSSRIYVTLTTSDGRGAMFSYQELFNTVVGGRAIVIVERDGAPLDESEGEFAFVSAADVKTGARKLRYLKSITVHEHGFATEGE